MLKPADDLSPSTGNRELDALLEHLEAERARLHRGDLRRLRYVSQLVHSGFGEIRRARRVLGQLVDELELRAAGEEPPADENAE